jgi:hypothetical protein
VSKLSTTVRKNLKKGRTTQKEETKQRLRTFPSFHPVLVFVFFFALYLGTAVLGGRKASPPDAYYDHLAVSFTGFTLDLPSVQTYGDLTLYKDRWYLPFAPFPAVLMMPVVAIGGIQAMNTVVFAALMGALACALLYVFLREGVVGGRKLATNEGALWLTVLFGAGSVHWYLSTFGSVWGLAQITGVAALMLATYLVVLQKNPWWIGLALSVAILSRLNLLLALPFLAGIRMAYPAGSGAREAMNPPAGWLVAVCLPVLVSLALLLAYNAARFGSPWDLGYATQNVAPQLVKSLREHGQFSTAFMGRNLSVMLFGLPRWVRECHLFLPRDIGMSVFLTTPALVLLVLARRRGVAFKGAWLSLLFLLLPILLYYNTGWRQFGYRFSLDFIIPVIVLLASAIGDRLPLYARILILAGVLVNAYGVAWINGWLC